MPEGFCGDAAHSFSFQFIAALTQAGLVKNKTYEFTSHEDRFRNRFQALACIAQPPMLTYDDYRAGSNFANVHPDDLLLSTGECFLNAKKLLETLGKRASQINEKFAPLDAEEVRDMMKICVGNSVFVMKLAQYYESNGGKQPSVQFDFKLSNQFCTIKLT